MAISERWCLHALSLEQFSSLAYTITIGLRFQLNKLYSHTEHLYASKPYLITTLKLRFLPVFLQLNT